MKWKGKLTNNRGNFAVVPFYLHNFPLIWTRREEVKFQSDEIKQKSLVKASRGLRRGNKFMTVLIDAGVNVEIDLIKNESR